MTMEKGLAATHQRAFILVDQGKVGTEKQCIGLAESMGYVVDLQPVSFPRYLAWLPPFFLRFFSSFSSVAFLFQGSPRAEMIFSGGRRAIAVASALKKRFPSIKVVHFLNPYGLGSHVDWVVRPSHDNVTSPNTIEMLGALTSLTPKKLEEVRRSSPTGFGELPKPYHVVLVGGANATHEFRKEALDELCADLRTLGQQEGSLLVSLSRRTPATFIPVIQKALKDLHHELWFHGCGQENPYVSYLAWGDSFTVTSDSVSMIMDVALTGKPMTLFYLPTRSKKFQRFYHSLHERGVFKHPYEPIDEKIRIAAFLKDRGF